MLENICEGEVKTVLYYRKGLMGKDKYRLVYKDSLYKQE